MTDGRVGDLSRCPSWDNRRSVEELIRSFDHMGYADGDEGNLVRWVSYGEAEMIREALSGRIARIAALEQAVTKIAEAAAPSRSDCIPCADIRRICAALVPQQEDAP